MKENQYKHKKRSRTSIQKPKGSRFTEEVKQLGPENVGIIPIDVHKDKHNVLMCNYYGKILKHEFVIPNTLTGVQYLLNHISDLRDKSKLKKVYVVMEYTGNYYKNLANRLRKEGITVTFVLSNSTYHLRQGQLNWCKTDSIDLCAIGQAFVNGWVSSSPPLDNFYENWQTLTRARRNEINMQTQAKNKITDILHQLMPGFQELFGNFWEHNASPILLQLAHSPEQLLSLNRSSFIQQLSKAKVQKPTDLVDKLQIWAKSSIGTSEDFPAKVQQLKIEWQHLLSFKENIQLYNLQIAQYLAQNQALLFLSIPWINVPSASEYAAEIGPFDNFASPKQIIAYLGLAPKKFQTGKVSFENGHITRKGKSHGRASVMNISNNLVQGNDYYTPNYLNFIARGKAKQHAKVAIANKFIRNSFRMVENGQLFSPPAWTGKDLANSPIEKLKDFLHNNTNDKELIEKIVTQAEQTLAMVLKEQTPCQQQETETQTEQTLATVLEEKTSCQPEPQAEQTLDRGMEEKASCQQQETEPQPKQDTQIPNAIHQWTKRKSVETKVVFSKTISPADYQYPVQNRNILENMVALGKLPPWVLAGKPPGWVQPD